MQEEVHSSVRTWVVILTAVATLLVVYPFSFGPMFWLCSDASNRVGGDFKSKVFLEVYRPAIWALQEGPQPVRSVMGSYLELWEK